STAVDFATGFGVWIVIFPSTLGSMVYLTPRMSPRIVLAAWGAGTLTRFRVTPSSLWSPACCSDSDLRSPTKRPVPLTTVGSLTSLSGPSEVPVTPPIGPCLASTRRSRAGVHVLTTDESSIVWHAEVIRIGSAARNRQYAVADFNTHSIAYNPTMAS